MIEFEHIIEMGLAIFVFIFSSVIAIGLAFGLLSVLFKLGGLK